MEDKKNFVELDEDELALVSGGKLDKEAYQWAQRNMKEVVARAKKKRTYKNLVKITPVIFKGPGVYTLDRLKEVLSRFADIDDLV